MVVLIETSLVDQRKRIVYWFETETQLIDYMNLNIKDEYYEYYSYEKIISWYKKQWYKLIVKKYTQ